MAGRCENRSLTVAARRKQHLLEQPLSGKDLVLASASADGTVKRWHRNANDDAFTPVEPKPSVPDHPGASPGLSRPGINCLVFSPPEWLSVSDRVTKRSVEKVLLSGESDGWVRTWSAGPIVPTKYAIAPHNDHVKGLAFSPTGRHFATACRDTQIRVWGRNELLPYTYSAVPLLRLAGHQKTVTGIAFHPNGKLLASSSDDRTVRLWSLVPEEDLPVLYGLPPNRRLDFSPDLKWFATSTVGARNELRLWNLRTGEPQRSTLFEHRGPFPTFPVLAFSPDQRKVMTAGGRGVVVVQDVSSTKEVLRLPMVETTTVPVTPSPVLAAAFVIDFQAKLDYIRTAAYSPDGTRFAVGGPNGIVLYDARSGLLLGRWWERGLSVEGLAFRGEGEHQQLVAQLINPTNGVRLIRTRDLKTGEQTPDLLYPFLWSYGSGSNAVCLSPDGNRLAVARLDDNPSRNVISLWDISAGRREPQLLWLETLPAHFPPSNLLGALVTTGVNTLSGHKAIVQMSFSRDGRLLATADTESLVTVRDTSSGRLLCSIPAPPEIAPRFRTTYVGARLGLSVSSRPARIAVEYPDGTAGVWELTGDYADTTSVKPILLRNDHTQPIADLVLNADGSRLATAGTNGTTVVQSLPPEKSDAKVFLQGTPALIVDLAFFDHGKQLAVADDGGTVYLWNRKEEYVQRAFYADCRLVKVGDTPAVRSNLLAVDSVGSRLATIAYDHPLRVIDVPKDRSKNVNIRVVGANKEGDNPVPVYSIALSPDGKRLATGGSDKRVRVYSLDSQEVKEIPGEHLQHEKGKVNCVAFSSDGRLLASASSDATVQVHNLEDLDERPIVLRGHTRDVIRVAFAKTGKFLATVGTDKTVRLWQLPKATPSSAEEASSLVAMELYNMSQQDVTPTLIAFGPGLQLATLNENVGNDRKVITYLFDTNELMRLTKQRSLRKWSDDDKKYLRGVEPIEP